MGTAYKGSSTFCRSIGQNIAITASKYKYKNGYFGENSKHGGDATRNIFSQDNLATAEDFYKKIAYGGVEKKRSENLRVTKMFDGTSISMRKVSGSDGTPVVQITIKRSFQTDGVKKQKIHFVQRDD